MTSSAKSLLTMATLAAATPVSAGYLCSGSDPDWQLEIAGDSATFVFPAPTLMDIPHRATAEGRDWPRALTLIGDRDTAILVLHNRQCGDAPFEAQVLTQRGQTAILLWGCCETSD